MSTAGRILLSGIRVFFPDTHPEPSGRRHSTLDGRGHGESDDDDDITEVAVATAPVRREREISIHDFKDGWTVVDATHTPKDPSRVWVSLESATVTLKVSIEEGVARTLRERLDIVLGAFSSIRNSPGAPHR